VVEEGRQARLENSAAEATRVIYWSCRWWSTELVVGRGARARSRPGLRVKDVAALRRCAVGFADPW